MAVNKVINILVQSTGAEKNVNKLNSELTKTNTLSTKVTQSSSGMGKGFNIANLGARTFAGGLRAVGMALKGMGIGLLLSLLAMLSTALAKNERVTKALGKVMDWVSDIVNAVVEVVAEFISKIKGAGDEMGSFQKIVKGVWSIIEGYFITYTNSIAFLVSTMAEKVASALNKIGVVSDESLEGIRNFKKDSAERVVEGVKMMKDGLNQAGEGFKEVGKAAKGAVGNFKEYREESKETREESKRLEQATKDLSAALDILKENFQTLYIGLNKELKKVSLSMKDLLKDAEDENKSYKERLTALQAYSKASVEQLKIREQIAQERVKEAQAVYNMDKSLTNRNKLLEAQSELEITQLEIQRDRNSLEGNLNDLLKSRQGIIDGINKDLNGQTEIERLEEEYNKRKEILERQLTDDVEADREVKEALLANDRWLAEQKNVIEVEREQELHDILEQIRIDNIEDADEKELERYEYEVEREMERALAELERLEATESEKAAVREYYEQKVADFKDEKAKEEENRQKALQKAIIGSVIGGMSQTLDALGAGADAKKGMAVSEALWNTFTGITKALDAGFPAAIPGILFASTTGFGAVANILKTDKSSKGGGNMSTPGSGASPNFNVVGDNSQTTMDEIDAKMANTATKAYVVGSEVSSQQELDRNRIKRGKVL